MPAGGVEGLQGAQEVLALAGVCCRHTEELEELEEVPTQDSGGYDYPNGVERLQREEPLLQNQQERDSVPGNGQGIPGSTQV